MKRVMIKIRMDGLLLIVVMQRRTRVTEKRGDAQEIKTSETSRWSGGKTKVRREDSSDKGARANIGSWPL